MAATTITPPTYLGDGVYASFDGHYIWLWTERDSGRHEIALEPPVMVALVAYADSVWQVPDTTPVDENDG